MQPPRRLEDGQCQWSRLNIEIDPDICIETTAYFVTVLRVMMALFLPPYGPYCSLILCSYPYLHFRRYTIYNMYVRAESDIEDSSVDKESCRMLHDVDKTYMKLYG